MANGAHVRWLEGTPPLGLPVTQVYGFCFTPEGKIVVLDDGGAFNLPGGKPKPGESYEQTLQREAVEEVQVALREVHLFGYRFIEHDPETEGGRPFAQLRAVALVDEEFPRAADPATGRVYRRHACAGGDVARLLDWGRDGEVQVACACKLAQRLWSFASDEGPPIGVQLPTS